MEFRLFDTLLEPIFILNEVQEVVYCNEPAALMCDLSSRKIVRNKMKFTEIFRFEDDITYFKDLKTVNESMPYLETRFYCEGGKEGKVQITTQPYYLADTKSWIIFFRDVTLEETLQKKYRAELEQKEDVIKDLQNAKAELQNYSKNLEKMVDERTAEVKKLNTTMTALLDSLQQGFFIFNKDGICLDVASKACLNTIQCHPSGMKIWDVLKLPEKQVEGFKKWTLTLFSEMLPFEDLAPLGPPTFPNSDGKHIQLEYYPLKDVDNQTDGIVVVASDISNLITAQNEAAKERSHVQMILKLVKHKKEVFSFINETQSLLSQLDAEIIKAEVDQASYFRLLHTLKGGAASFSIQKMVDICHHAENYLSEYKYNPTPELLEKLKVNSKAIRPTFQLFLEDNRQIIGNPADLKERMIEKPLSVFVEFSKVWSTQKEFINSFNSFFILEPIENYFRQYDEVLQNIAANENKQIKRLKYINGDLKIYPEPYESLFSTFIHAFRNSIDHGIETPEERLKFGKPEAGQIIVEFSTDTKNLFINISDDGRGIDPAIIRKKLFEKGINADAESDQKVIQHVFDSQLSTKDQVTELSGRGVGMDAILIAAKKLNGHARVESSFGKGMTLKIEIPYINAIQAPTLKAA